MVAARNGIRDGSSGSLLQRVGPRDLDAFASLVEERAAAVEGLMLTGRLLVEGAERLVCALYGLPPDLEDAVVHHAVTRAARRSTPIED